MRVHLLIVLHMSEMNWVFACMQADAEEKVREHLITERQREKAEVEACCEILREHVLMMDSESSEARTASMRELVDMCTVRRRGRDDVEANVRNEEDYEDRLRITELERRCACVCSRAFVLCTRETHGTDVCHADVGREGDCEDRGCMSESEGSGLVCVFFFIQKKGAPPDLVRLLRFPSGRVDMQSV